MCSIVDFLVHKSHVSVKIIQFEKVFLYETLLGLVQVLVLERLETEHLCGLVYLRLLSIAILVHLAFHDVH